LRKNLLLSRSNNRMWWRNRNDLWWPIYPSKSLISPSWL
jgi:hypothetical protein